MSDEPPALKIKLQIYCGEEIAMGPGKADLLDAIAREGSISAAGRALGMSYRRAWLLVDVMNRCWRQPLVLTAAGGQSSNGARLTLHGTDVLRRYRALQDGAASLHSSEDWTTLRDGILPTPKVHQKAG